MSGLKSGKKKKIEAEDVAWKKLHGDVFRTPMWPNIFACLVGIGTQVFGSVYFTLIFSCIAFHFYNLRPYLLSISLVALACMGWMNGYMCSRILKLCSLSVWSQSPGIRSDGRIGQI